MIVGSFWHHVKMISTSFWNHFRIMLWWFWHHVKIILISFLHMFKICSPKRFSYFYMLTSSYSYICLLSFYIFYFPPPANGFTKTSRMAKTKCASQYSRTSLGLYTPRYFPSICAKLIGANQKCLKAV